MVEYPVSIVPLEIIGKFYKADSLAWRLLVTHSEKVAQKALRIAFYARAKARVAGTGGVDEGFIYEAAMLHDIGILLTDAPALGCSGTKPYICHGFLGRYLLEKEGLYRHALVAERHVGVGLTAADIREQKLPLPERDMTPKSIEEIIISYADKFYSKGKDPAREKTAEEARRSVARYGEDKLKIFDEWLKIFEP